jgi:hypothetical protein
MGNLPHVHGDMIEEIPSRAPGISLERKDRQESRPYLVESLKTDPFRSILENRDSFLQ